MPRPAESTEIFAGLLTGGAPVPLLGVSVEAQVKDFCSRVVVTQRYRNQESHPIEAVYVFPLDEGAAVCGFEALIDEVLVVGEVQEREKAFETYDDAIAQGHGAYLLDQERADVFTASIGNVPPGKEVSVRITYVAEVALEGEDRRFVVPTTVSPRYAPAEDRKGVGQTPEERLSPPVDFRVPYGLELAVHLEMPSAIRGVDSPSHPIGVEIDGTRATVRLGADRAALDRDFVLTIRVAETDQPKGWVEVDEKGRRAAVLSFQPRFEAGEAPCEMIFLVDRSGSMGGTSIEEAKNALQLSLRSLSAGSRFNIVGFGSSFASLFPESRPYDDETLAAASAHVKGLGADLGGTEILAPLKAILERKADPELPRQLFVFTDGQVTNTSAVLQLVRRHSGTTRVFTFGIGHGASRHLVRGMARAGEGASEFITPGERLEGKVMRQLARALAPALTELRVDWGGLKVRQAPHLVPPVFAGGRVLVYGLLEESSAGTARLTARSPKGPLSWEIRVDPEFAERGNVVTTLAARGLIRDLEEEMSPLHDRRGSLQGRITTDRVKQEILRLGVDYKLSSRETSFVAVEKRETSVEGEMKLRRVPVALTRDWGGLEDMLMGGPRSVAASVTGMGGFDASPARPAAPLAAAGPPSFFSKLARWATSASPPDSMADLAAGASFDMEDSGPLASESQSHSTRPLDRLVALQRADGSWELGAELAAVLKRPLEALESSLIGATGDPGEVRRAWATALAIAWLQKEGAEWRDEWILLERKASRWLSQCGARPRSGRDWLEKAAAFLSEK